ALQRPTEPWVLIRGVVDDQLHDDAQSESSGLLQEDHEVAERAEARVDCIEIGHVVAVVPLGALEEGIEPNGVHTQSGYVVELAGETGEFSLAVSVGDEEGAGIDLVDDRLCEPRAGHRSPGTRFRGGQTVRPTALAWPDSEIDSLRYDCRSRPPKLIYICPSLSRSSSEPSSSWLESWRERCPGDWASRRSSSSSGSACWPAPTGRAGSTSATPTWPAPSAPLLWRSSCSRVGSIPAGRRCDRSCDPASFWRLSGLR